MISLLESFDETNQNDFANVGIITGNPSSDITAAGTTFSCPSNLPLYSAKFYLKKTGSPTGNAFAKIYNMSGTYGTNGKPNGAVLATSKVFDVSTLTGSYQVLEFLFIGANAINMSAGIQYCVAFDYRGGDSSNYVNVGGKDIRSSGGNGFIGFDNGSTLGLGSSGAKFVFYVYGGTLPASGLLLFE